MAGTGPSRVVFDAVAQSYDGSAPVLSDLQLEASPGDFIGILGPSGCGKTTLLRLLAGLNAPTAGKILIDGLPPQDSGHDVSYVFQEPNLLPWLTVQDNAGLLLRLRRCPREAIATRCAEALRMVRLKGLEKRYPRQLSGGQRMRVSLARALSVSPRLLLLDEPFAALDEMTREHLNEELLTIREETQWTAFFVSHSVTEAVFLSNRILVMSTHPGRIHAEIEVPFPYPRNAETRLSPEFLALVARVSRILRSLELKP